jgi:ubiquitin-conjugating enzyme E2 J2
MAICTSFTNYHQESWTSAWNVRSLIQATISFMYANEPSYGCKQDSSVIRKKNARDSLGWNMRNELFVRSFGEKII